MQRLIENEIGSFEGLSCFYSFCFSFVLKMRRVILLICLINQLVNADPIGLRVPATLRGFLLGSAAQVNSLKRNIDQGQYVANLKKNYQLIVPEFEMKPQHLWLGENVYDFTDPDWLIGNTSNSTGWIQENDMQLRGHTLVWAGNSHIPKWLLKQQSSITPEKAKELLSDYIHTVVGRYKNKIQWWDVVNEVIEDSYNNSHPFNLRPCFWYDKLGVDYIKYAFQFAHEADPNAKLYYNDFNIQYLGKKASRAVQLIQWLKSEGVPIDGIGIQWHTNSSIKVTPNDTYYQSAQDFLDLGIDLMVTELDVAVEMNGSQPLDPTQLTNQANVYRSLLDYAFQFYPRCPALLTWGFTDRYSWIPEHYNYTKGDALLLDTSYQPKPAYLQLQQLLSRVIPDGIYCLYPQSQPNEYLSLSNDSTSDDLQLSPGQCQLDYAKWNVTWNNDGTYRISSLSNENRVLTSFNSTESVGQVKVQEWTDDVNQQWVFTRQTNMTFRLGPRPAWSRVMTPDQSNHISILDFASTKQQFWIFKQFHLI